MKKLALGILFLLLTGLVVIVGGLFLIKHAKYNNTEFFQTEGDKNILKALMAGSKTEDWDTFFKTIGAKGKVVSVKAEKKRFYLAFADPKSGDYSPGDVILDLEVRDLLNNKEIYKKTYKEMLPMAVMKEAGESAQETAYKNAERKLVDSIKDKIADLVYPMMLNFPDKKDVFMPIMEKRINDPKVSIRYAAGRALLEYGNEAVPAIVRAAQVSRNNDIACAYMINNLKYLKPDAIPQLEKLLNNPSEKIRGAVVSVLTQFINIDPTAKKIVLDAVQGKDKYVKQSAVKAIEKMGKKAAGAPEIMELLLALMLSGEKGTDWQASKALCALGKPAFPTLLKALENKKLHDRLRYDMCRETPEVDRSALFPMLLELKKKGTPTQQQGAEIVLNYWPATASDSYYRALAEAAASEDRNVRLETVQLLADKMGGAAKGKRRGYTSVRPIVGETLAKALQDEYPEIRKIASAALLSGNRNSAGTKAIGQAMVYKLKTCPENERIDYLNKIFSQSVREEDIAFFIKLVTDKDEKVAARATEIMIGHRDLKDKIIPELVKVLPNTSYSPRNKIISFLGQKDYVDKYLPEIIENSWEPVGKKEINIRSILYYSKLDSKNIAAIRKIIENHPSERTRCSAVSLLKNFDNKGISEVPFLIDLMGKGKAKGLESDLFYFFKEHGDAGLEGVVYCLGGSPHTSGQAYRYLAKQDKAKVVPLLKKVQKTSKNPEIQKDTTALIKKFN